MLTKGIAIHSWTVFLQSLCILCSESGVLKKTIMARECRVVGRVRRTATDPVPWLGWPADANHRPLLPQKLCSSSQGQVSLHSPGHMLTGSIRAARRSQGFKETLSRNERHLHTILLMILPVFNMLCKGRQDHLLWQSCEAEISRNEVLRAVLCPIHIIPFSNRNSCLHHLCATLDSASSLC